MDTTAFLEDFLYESFMGSVISLSAFLSEKGISKEVFEDHFFNYAGFLSEDLRHIKYGDQSIFSKINLLEGRYSQSLFNIMRLEGFSSEEVLDSSLKSAYSFLTNIRDLDFYCFDFSKCCPSFFNEVLISLSKTQKESEFLESLKNNFYKPLFLASKFELAMRFLYTVLNIFPKEVLEGILISGANREYSTIRVSDFSSTSNFALLVYFCEFKGSEKEEFLEIPHTNISRIQYCFSKMVSQGGGACEFHQVDLFKVISSMISHPFIRGYLCSFGVIHTLLIKKYRTDSIFSQSFLSRAEHFINLCNQYGVTSPDDWKSADKFFL